MRSSLAVLGLLTLAASLWALWTDHPAIIDATSPRVSRTANDMPPLSPVTEPSPAMQTQHEVARSVLAAQLSLRPASRDIFQTAAAPAMAVPPPPAVLVAAPLPTGPLEPAVPPLEHRFQGRMRTPDGVQVVLLRRGNLAVQIKEGQQLEDGYQVLAISADSIGLRHVVSGTEATISIPVNPDAPKPW